MKYKCLILDHDDTVFDSTKSIHYPAFLETLSQLRSGQKPISYEAFTHHCHTYGFQDLCDRIYAFTNEEMKIEYKIWKSYTQSRLPLPFEGWKYILNEHLKQGGYVVVISHSESSEIKRDYLTHFQFEPHLIYGWELGEAFRKPETYPLEDAFIKLHLSTHECLVIDDMQLGLQMAQKLDVNFAWAAWSHLKNGIIVEKENPSILYFESIDGLRDYLEY